MVLPVAIWFLIRLRLPKDQPSSVPQPQRAQVMGLNQTDNSCLCRVPWAWLVAQRDVWESTTVDRHAVRTQELISQGSVLLCKGEGEEGREKEYGFTVVLATGLYYRVREGGETSSNVDDLLFSGDASAQPSSSHDRWVGLKVHIPPL